MKALAILATVALVLLGRWWRDALSDARLAAVDDIDWLAEYRFVPKGWDPGPIEMSSGFHTLKCMCGTHAPCFVHSITWRN
jgi:hypothetical protein